MSNNIDFNIEGNEKPFIYSDESFHCLKNMEVLEDGQNYIYVIENYPAKNIKIGKTGNVMQRYKSLSGSNGGGNRILRMYCSPATWIPTMEQTCHNHYHFARISGTEWFDGSKVSFDDVVDYVNGLFFAKSYKTCNELRRKLIEKKNDNKGN
jgi:hypothetical protein